MKKIYKAPALEITNIQMMQMIAESIDISGEGSHSAETKEFDPWASDTSF